MEGPTVSHSRNFWLSFFFFPFFTVCAFLHVLFFLFPFTLGGFFFFFHWVRFVAFFFFCSFIGFFFWLGFSGFSFFFFCSFIGFFFLLGFSEFNFFFFLYWVQWVWVLKKKNCIKWQVWGPQIVWQILSDEKWVIVPNGCEKLSDEW